MTDRDPPATLTDAFLDRIVDGGLSPAELRGAIERLEDEPEGWRRCALAFLEAQCWRESFRAERSPAPALPGVIVHAVPEAPRSRRNPGGWRWVAMAAAIAAISFGLGWRVHPDRPTAPGAGASSSMANVDHPRPSLTPEIDVPEVATRPTIAEPGPRIPAPAVVTVGQVQIGTNEGAPRVPILAGPGIDEDWLKNQPPPITEHQQALLEQQGFQVDRRRRLVTARLHNGRRVTVPVDQVQVRYTGIEPL